jgi:perosamine synthetase
MWPRKQLDIGWSDFAYGLRCVLSPKPRPADDEVVSGGWIPPREVLISLSVRTAWNLFLNAQRFPSGSEIIVSGVTIPDMIRIIEHHGLVAVPVDVDADRLEPSLDDLERAVSPRTRAMLVAHLFGARIDMEPIIRLARQHDLLVIEDCAQAFVGRDYAGHPETDCSLFSFGPIKTASALGGAVTRVRDAAVRAQMAALQRMYPVQCRRAYLSRLAKYALFRMLCAPRLYGVLVRAYRLLGVDYDRALSNAAHSFSRGDFFEKIQHQPCPALVRLLARRLSTFESQGAARLRRRCARGNQLADMLPGGMIVGGQNFSHTYWVMPVRVANANKLVEELRLAGFDATSRSSMVIVRSELPDDGSELAAWLAETVFLPNGDDVPDDEWLRMSSVVREVAREAHSYRRHGTATAGPVLSSS